MSKRKYGTYWMCEKCGKRHYKERCAEDLRRERQRSSSLTAEDIKRSEALRLVTAPISPAELARAEEERDVRRKTRLPY
jgi:hypothetical protein